MFLRTTALIFALLCNASFSALEAAQGIDPLIRFRGDEGVYVSDATCDAEGHIYVCGVVRRGASLPGKTIVRRGTGQDQYDAFVMKLRASGAPIATLVLSGNGYETAERIAVDTQGNVVIYGYTTSTDFPVLNALYSTPNGYYPSFVCKLDSTITNIVFSSFLHGTGIRAMTVDSDDNIVLAGVAAGGPGIFPQIPEQSSDLFVLKLAPTGTNILYATLLGVRYYADVLALATDNAGVVYAVGSSGTAEFPLLNALQPFKPAPEGNANAFLTRIGTNGALLSSTFLGGNCHDRANSVAVNEAGEIYVAGVTGSGVFPATSEFSDLTCDTSDRAFLLKLGAGATNLIYSKLFAFTGKDHLSDVIAMPDGTALAGGTLGASDYQGGVRFLVQVASDASDISYFIQNCGDTKSIERLALHPSGRILLTGYDADERSDNLGSYAELANLSQLADSPALHIVSPNPFSTVGTNQSLQITALATGFSDEIQSVTFHEGKIVLGSASNAPYSIQVPSLTRGTHRLTAVAHMAVGQVASCPVVIKVRSPRNDNFSNRIQVAGQRVTLRGDTFGATVEPGEMHSYYYSSEGSVWYSWRAPSDGAFEFSLSDQSYVSATIMTGDDLSLLQSLSYFYAGSPSTLLCHRGQTYHIRIAHYERPLRFQIQIRRVTSPPNDNFANAQSISGLTPSVSGNFAHTTREPGEPGYGDTLWYSWTAPVSGLYLASSPNGLANIAVYTGSALTNLVSRGQTIYGLTNGSAFYADAGETFFLSVSRANFLFAFTLSIEPYSPPPNDAFENRISIPAGTFTATGGCIGATAQVGEAQTPYNPKYSVWFKWIAPSNSAYRVSTVVPYPPPIPSPDGSAPLGRPARAETTVVYEGDALVGLTLASSSSFPANEQIWHAEPGHEYQISVSGGAAFFTLNITPVPKPPNDDFTNAIVLIGSQRITGTTSGAGLEPDEPEHAQYFQENASVWYRWTAPSNGLFKVESSAAVKIYAGTTLSTLTPAPLAGADNLFRAEEGAVFLLAVFNYSYSYTLDFTLRVRPAFPPPNDDFANAIPLVGFNFVFAARTRDATEPEESFTPRSSVWYSWTAPTNGGFALRCTNIYGANISVYTGDALSNLTFIAESSSTAVDFNAQPGERFYFSIDGASSYGQPDFLIELLRYPRPPNDNFADAIVLTGTNVSISVTNRGATIETNEPTLEYSGAGRSVWYSWTAPRSGRASFSAEGDFQEVMSLFTGDQLATLVAVRPIDFNSRFNVEVEAGVTYRISIDGYIFNGSGVCELDIHYATPPLNDDFAQRLFLTNGMGTGTLEAASREPSEPDYDTDPLGSSVWWTYLPLSNGVHYLQTSGSQIWPRARVYRGHALNSLQSIDTGQYYNVRFIGEIGVPVVIQLSGIAGAFGNYTFTIEYEPAPTNDLFASRVAFTNSVRGTLKGATVEPGEPNSEFGKDSSVWWTWTAPQTGAYEVKVVEPQSGSSLYGIAGRLFTGTNLPALQELPVHPIDFYHGWIYAEEGTTYSVAVVAPELTEVHFLLSLVHQPGPTNDFFANRVAFAGAGFSVTGSTLYATREPGEYGVEQQTVWYSWTPAFSATAMFLTYYGTQLDIFTGSSVSNLIRLAGTSPGGNSVSWPVSANEEYQVRVAAASGFTFTLNVTTNTLPPPPLLPPPGSIAARRFVMISGGGTMIETSTNLVDWQPWRTNENGTWVSISVGEEPQRFFRVR